MILNKDVSYQPDPILLEEPSHVMLNHLYAQVISKTLGLKFVLSIKSLKIKVCLVFQTFPG